MRKALLLTAALVTIGACAAAAQTSDYLEPAPVHTETMLASEVDCAVFVDRTRNGVRLAASARSLDGAPSAGTYEFVVTKSDANGVSDVVQAGEFDFFNASEQDLGEVEMWLDRGARLDARLVLRDADGAVCEAEAGS